MKLKHRVTGFILALVSFLCIHADGSRVFAHDTREVVALGELFGVELDLAGVLVTDFAPFESEGQSVSPASNAGLLPGDLIVRVQNSKVEDLDDFLSALQSPKQEVVTVSFLRGAERKETHLHVRRGDADGKYHAGLWVKEALSGVGTVTYYDPKTGNFGGLGHAIAEREGDPALLLEKGSVYEAHLKSVVRGKVGAPGELRAAFGQEVIGSVSKNTSCGVFGQAKFADNAPLVEVADASQVHEGAALVRCTVEGEQASYYEVLIDEIQNDGRKTKNFVVTVTDERLLEKTGGIVQGMSGSPILQDGKLIGALTHVLVRHPAKGYGIFIENMLNAA